VHSPRRKLKLEDFKEVTAWGNSNLESHRRFSTQRLAWDKPDTDGDLPLVVQLATLAATMGGALAQFLEDGTRHIGLHQRLVEQRQTSLPGGDQVGPRHVISGAYEDILSLG